MSNRNDFLYGYKEGEVYALCAVNKLTGIALYSNTTMEQEKEEHPDAVFLEYEELEKKVMYYMEKKYVTEPREISEEDFREALNCLPPMNWNNYGAFEYFHMSEFTISHYTGTYVRCGEKFFYWTDSAYATVDQIREKLFNKFPELRK